MSRLQFLYLLAAMCLLTQGAYAQPPCGGAIDSDAGTFHFYDPPDADFSSDHPCVWIIRLHSTSDLAITATSVQGATTSIEVFTSEAVNVTLPVVAPLFVFNQSTVDSTFRTQFSTAILVLKPSNQDRAFTVSWEGESLGTGFAPIETANYLDQDVGIVEVDDYGLAVLALVLNPPQGVKVDVTIKILGYEDDCVEGVAYAIFAPLPTGGLRELIRTCGLTVPLPSLTPPLIAFVVKPNLTQSETIHFSWGSNVIPDQPPTSCGGSLQANQGLLQYSDVEGTDPTRACVWSLRLQSKSRFRTTLLDISTGTGVGVFSSAQAGSSDQIISPTHALNETALGVPLNTDGEIMILILNPSTSGTPRRFSIVWDGLVESPAGAPESLTYLDSNEGALTQNDAHLSLTAFIISPPEPFRLDLEVAVLGYEEVVCAPVAFSTFDVLPNGNMREVVRVCGFPVTVNVMPPLVSFVAKLSPAQNDTVSISWASVRPPPGTSTTPNPELVISQECGGVLVGQRGLIRYKIQSPYVRNERCVWTIRAELFTQVEFQLTDDGLYTVPGFDYLTISTIPDMDGGQLISTDRIIQGGYRSPFTVRGPIVFVQFRTSQGGPRGFELRFEGVGSQIPVNRYNFNHEHYNASLNLQQEPFRYPESGNYAINEFATFVFNQGLLNFQYRLGLRFEYIDLEQQATCSFDALSIHESNPAAGVDHLLRICPTGSSTVREFTSEIDGGTFIVLFKTDSSVVATGFRGTYSYLRV